MWPRHYDKLNIINKLYINFIINLFNNKYANYSKIKISIIIN